MIAYLNGTLIFSSETEAIIDVRGVGYRVFIPCSLFAKLPNVGETVTLQTSLVIRETAQTLFGFLSQVERDVFEKLMDVSGIGPKIALALIGHLSLKELCSAITTKDLATLCRVPGIGKKGAERLSLELRDTIKALCPDFSSLPESPSPEHPHISDAMSALIRLGYHQSNAQKAIKQSLESLPKEAGLAELITSALRCL